MKDSVNVHLGKRIRMLRQNKGMTQSEFGKILGVASQQVQKYEKGDNRISAAKLHMISKRFRISLESFFEGIEDEFPHMNEDSLLDDFYFDDNSRESLTMLSAYYGIKNKKCRATVRQLMRYLGDNV